MRITVNKVLKALALRKPSFDLGDEGHGADQRIYLRLIRVAKEAGK